MNSLGYHECRRFGTIRERVPAGVRDWSSAQVCLSLVSGHGIKKFQNLFELQGAEAADTSL